MPCEQVFHSPARADREKGAEKTTEDSEKHRGYACAAPLCNSVPSVVETETLLARSACQPSGLCRFRRCQFFTEAHERHVLAGELRHHAVPLFYRSQGDHVSVDHFGKNALRLCFGGGLDFDGLGICLGL